VGLCEDIQLQTELRAFGNESLLELSEELELGCGVWLRRSL